ncbi:odorant receptor 69a, partial [Olea europaea subsp. europaea]
MHSKGVALGAPMGQHCARRLGESSRCAIPGACLLLGALMPRYRVSPARQSTSSRPAILRMWRIWLVIQAYSATLILFILVTMIATGTPYSPLYAFPDTWWANVACVIIEILVCSFAALSFFTLFAVLVDCILALTAMFDVIAVRIEQARGKVQIMPNVHLHQRINSAALQLQKLFSNVLVHLLAAIFVVPIVSTMQIALGHVDLVSGLKLPMLFVIFLPFSYNAQGLKDSSENVCLSVYRGSWLEEDVPTRKMLLMVMKRASMPAVVSVNGFGTIDLPAAHK